MFIGLSISPKLNLNRGLPTATSGTGTTCICGIRTTASGITRPGKLGHRRPGQRGWCGDHLFEISAFAETTSRLLPRTDDQKFTMVSAI